MFDHAAGQLDQANIKLDFERVIVLTQTCDFAKDKIDLAVVALVFDAQMFVEANHVKARM